MRQLAIPQNTIEVLQKHDFHMQKKYGQNFLVDGNILNRILESAELTEEDGVLEIGPGIGTMTQALAESAGKVLAIEIDKKLIPILKDNLQDYSNLEILQADVMKLNLREVIQEHFEGKRVKVVANLPYYITTPVIMKLLEENLPIHSITVMIQKEVAERMQEKPGSRTYGSLSLAVQYYAKTEIVAQVPPTCFIPRPKVGSCVIRLLKYPEPPVETKDSSMMFAVIKAAFGQRRKTMVNAIMGSPELHVPKEAVIKALEDTGLTETIRGEKLSLSQFAEFTDCLIRYL